MSFFKYLSSIGLILALIFFNFSLICQNKSEKVLLRELKKFFVDPPAEFRPIPLWVWNEEMTVSKIKEQLKDFKEKGFGGVFVHPRPGLITPYLSKEWLSLFRETVNLGRELGLKIWIYDENSYPSGFAGGLVPEAMPEATNLGLKGRKIEGSDLLKAIKLEEKYPNQEESSAIRERDSVSQNEWSESQKGVNQKGASQKEASQEGVSQKNLSQKERVSGREAIVLNPDIICILKEEAGKFVDITEAIKSGEKTWPEGNYWIFQLNRPEPSSWYGGFTYVDLMKPGVTETFIRLTHDAYKQVCGSEFGRTIPGTFQDEAHIGPPGNSWTINFTPALFEEFSRRRGYDLKMNLPLLFEDTGEFRQVRHDFYLTCLELFIENWARVYFNYCEKNNLQLTGHYWEHDWPRPRLVPDNMALYAYAHIPGIDILMNEWSLEPNAQFGNARAVKEIRSVANQLGRSRTLSETYGASGWDLTFFDQKRIGDWEYALGVNFLNQHLCFSTIMGSRKRDHPLSFSYHEPWWLAYRLMNDYFARLSLVLSSGEQINRILIIEPTTSAWMYYSPATKSEKFEAIAANFQNFIHELEKFQIEYDLASELMIKNYGQIRDKKFGLGLRNYDLLILPPGLENLEPWTKALIKEFLDNGGLVVSWSEKEIREAGKASFLFAELKSYKNFKNLYGEPLRSLFSLYPEILSSEIIFENLTGEEKLFHHRRQFKDGQLLFLANVNEDKAASGEVRVKGQSAEKWQALCGQIEPFQAKAEGEWISLDFYLNPGESLLLAIYKGKKPNEKNLKDQKSYNLTLNESSNENKNEAKNIFSLRENKGDQKDKFIQIELRPTVIRRLDPNVLVIDYCDLIIGGKEEKDLYFYEAQKKVFAFYGFERNPWDSAVQFKDSLLAKNKFPADSGFRADFPLEVASGVKLDSLRLVVERPEIFKVVVNGQKLEPVADSWWLDKNFGLFDLSRVVREGHNLISLVVRPFSLMAELELIYILGDFAVERAAKGFLLKPEYSLELGSWKDQGLPFYGHRVLYEAELNLMANDLAQYEFYFQAPNWHGTIAELNINDELSDIKKETTFTSEPENLPKSKFLLSRYDSVRINPRLRRGENKIKLIIYGSLRNTLGPHHLNPPRGRAWPLAFQKVPPEGQPPGSEYSFLDYGLFSPSLIKMIKR